MTVATALVEGELRMLRKAAVLPQLGGDELMLLLSVAERRCYAKGQMVVASAAVEEQAFVVIRGGVRLYLPSTCGRELTLYRRRAGDVFQLAGQAFGPRNNGREPAEEIVAEALVGDTVVYVIPWLRFLSSAASGRDAASDLGRLLRMQCREERAVIREQAFYDRKARLAHKLAQLAADSDAIVDETRQSLGTMTAVRAEDVTKALYELRDEGLVDFEPHKHRRIVVRDIEALVMYAT